MQIYPDIELLNGDRDYRFRLGMIVRDAEGRKWGLTARHVFGEADSARILTKDGELFSEYRADANASSFPINAAINQIVRFPIPTEFFDSDSVPIDVTWPREVLEEVSLLGTNVVSSQSPDQVIGTITEVSGFTRMSVGRDPTGSLIRGTALLTLENPLEAAAGMAGTLVLSQFGEAIGLGIALQQSEYLQEMVICPLEPYLLKHAFRPWAPPGAQWSDLPQRVANFLKDAESDPGPSLGSSPDSGNRN